jgi:LemA protein
LTVLTTILIVGGLLVVAVVVYGIGIRNRFVRLGIEADQGFAGIDVQLQRRNDLIPNLVETVKGYAGHERDVFEHVSEARAATLRAQSVGDKAAADQQLTGALGRLFAVAEAYPQLRASETFLELQGELADTEDKLAAARRYYNGVCERYNTSLQVFPANLLAGGRTPRDFFETTPAVRDAGAPKVAF